MLSARCPLFLQWQQILLRALLKSWNAEAYSFMTIFSKYPRSQAWTILLTIVLGLFGGTLGAQEPVEFDTGRPQPSLNGSGLAMSKGRYRGLPVGELSGWTMALWFEARSEKGGEIFGIVTNESKDEAFRLAYDGGSLKFGSQDKPDRKWELVAEEVELEKWHQVAITYDHAIGPTLFLDGKRVDEGRPGQMGYATDFNHYYFSGSFDGLIDDFVLHDRAFTDEEVAKMYQGEPFEDSLVTFNDFENVSHRDLAQFSASDRDESYLTEGKELYELNCIACHSIDGETPPPNPLSRMFTKSEMENGGDPYSMFRTLTYGFRNMMPAVQLKPEERYKVIHYLREQIIKEKAPGLYVEVDDTYTVTMPTSPEDSGEAALRAEALAKTGYLRDYGRALISPVVGEVSSLNALTIDLGNETTISYDLGTMRPIGAWTGGLLDFSNTLHNRLRAAGLPKARFEMIPGLGSSRWAWDGKAENEVPDLGNLSVWPAEQLRYRGRYPNGETTIVSYSVLGRGVLESPFAELIAGETAIHRRFTIDPGTGALELIVSDGGEDSPEIDGGIATLKTEVVYLQGGAPGLGWRVSESGELVLMIPAAEKPISFNIVVAPKILGSDTASAPSDQVVDLLTKLEGGPRRWQSVYEMKGRLGTSTFQGYEMDSLPVPLKNAYNSWMRTSSLAFFPDGRLAVGTLAGDIWIVSGINEGLENVTWQRFAAGLYEPMGMKVIDGVLTATTRGRIVKLHDYNGDGEADFYEAFFNEREPSAGWHAYNSDLEVGEDGSLYYGRTGSFSKWSVPGGVVRVFPDGKNSEVIGEGMRVPNGIGLLQDGRITFSDNQGGYVPASKIAITKRGAFHGSGGWEKREGDYDLENIAEPIVYLPQELDSSSGSQLWVEKDDRFGPLSGHYFHTSYGRASTMVVMLDDLGDTVQGAVFSLPLKMESGTLRVAKNPVDGQLYYSGLTGWQAGASREGSIQRLRYTGKEGIYLEEAKARRGRLELTFSEPVPQGGVDQTKWAVSAWNYRWSKRYGSPKFKVSEPGEEGTDSFEIADIERVGDGRKIVVQVPELQPCHTLELEFSVAGEGSRKLSGSVYFTIHELPE